MIKSEEYKLKIKELKGILLETGHSLWRWFSKKRIRRKNTFITATRSLYQYRKISENF